MTRSAACLVVLSDAGASSEKASTVGAATAGDGEGRLPPAALPARLAGLRIALLRLGLGLGLGLAALPASAALAASGAAAEAAVLLLVVSVMSAAAGALLGDSSPKVGYMDMRA